MIMLATVSGPWGPPGEEIRVSKPTGLHKHYLDNGVLLEINDLTPKERVVVKAEVVGVNAEGTKAEIEARIEEVQDGPS